jgi:Domain of unknown function (DUF4292)
MKQFLSIMFLVILASSCKTKQVATSSVKEPANAMTSKKIIENYDNNKIDFSTLSINADVSYADAKQTQNVSADIKIKKDEKILISIRFFGITMAKAFITPTSVSYYEKIKGTYFEGDFSFLSQFLGTDLNFYKLQNLLIGKAIDDLKKGKYKELLENQTYRLDDFSDTTTQKLFFIASESYLMQKQEIAQPAAQRKIEVTYPNNFSSFAAGMLPKTIKINANQQKGNTEIELEYNKITFNEELSFPYSVPDGYKKIIIK